MTKAAKARKARRALAQDTLPRRKFGNIIRRKLGKDVSRNDLAAKVRDAASQMSRLLNGHDEEFSFDRMAKFAVRTGARITVLVHTRRMGLNRRRGKVTFMEVR
jgi:hypothetical protein